jgi:hypothetical protein
MSSEEAEIKVVNRSKRLFLFAQVTEVIASILCVCVCVGYFKNKDDTYGRSFESILFGVAAVCLGWGFYKLIRKLKKYDSLFGDNQGRRRFIISFSIITATCALEFICLLIYEPI